MKILLAILGLFIGTAHADVTLTSDTTYDCLIVATGSTLTTDGFDVTVNGTGTCATLVYGAIDASQSGLNSTKFENNGSFVTAVTGDALFTGTSDLVLTSTGSIQGGEPHTLTISGSVVDLTLDNGLVGYWKMDDGEGSGLARDYSRSNFNCDLTNMDIDAAWSTDTSSTIQFHNTSSLDFDGSDDHLDCGDVPKSEIGSRLTVMYWINPETLEVRDTHAKKWDGSIDTNNTWGIRAQNSATDEIFFFIAASNDPGSNYLETTDLNISSGTWQHITAWYDGTQTVANRIKAYKDGVQAGGTINGTIPTSLNSSTSSITFGDELFSGASYYEGLLDDFRVYNRALTDSEIREIANGNLSNGSGTYTLGSSLDINGHLTMLTGELDNSGNHDLNVAKAWRNYGGNYIEGTETVTLDGTEDTLQNDIWEDGDFNNLTIDNGLVGYWKLDDGVGSDIARDSSQYGNNGTLVNMEDDDWVDISAGTGTTQFWNTYALNFDGSDTERVAISSDSIFDFTNEFSVTAWAKINDDSSSLNIVTKYDGSSSNNDSWILTARGANNDIRFNVRDEDGNGWKNADAGTLSVAGGWAHVAGTFNGSEIRAYVDGVSGTATSKTDAVNVGAKIVTIGCPEACGGNSPMDGLIDDVRLYNRGLSASEVARLANGYQETGSGVYVLGTPLDISGNIENYTGTVHGSGNTIWVKGDWINNGEYGFQIGTETGHVILNGAGNQNMTGSTVFQNFSYTGSTTLTLDYRARQSFSGALTLQNLTLRSSLTGSASNILLDDDSGSQTVDTVDVQDNDASGGTEIDCSTGCTDSGNNTNWGFAAAAPSPPSPQKLLFQMILFIPEWLKFLLLS